VEIPRQIFSAIKIYRILNQQDNNLDYIIGARMANLPLETIQKIAQDLKQ
jgi:hypothetical protein